jgi:galactoside 2-L-fucosyltransferase 1/2
MASKTYHPNPHLHVKVNLLGRLGNNLFQFASGYGIAAKHNATFCLHGDRSLLTIAFDTKFSTFDCPGWSSPVVLENGYATYETFSVINKAGGLTLGVPWGNNGFLQSWRYFEEVNAEVRHHLTFHNHIRKKAEMYLKANTKAGTTFRVGIHVRHGDVNKFGYLRTPGIQFYLNAKAYFTSKHGTSVAFVVGSDDTAWCKKQKAFAGAHIIVEKHAPSEDMAILANCDAVITTIGTFGWWAGWLSGGEVVYWKNQFNLQHDINRGKVVESDYFPPEWKAIDDTHPLDNHTLKL